MIPFLRSHHRYVNKEQAVEIIKEIIEKNLKEMGKDLKVNIYCYTIGKEEICIGLAKVFKTKIYLEKERYKYVKNTNYYVEYFTTRPEEAFIRLASGVNQGAKKSELNTIHINLTGWINCKTYISTNPGEYMVAYSSHSNYPELDRFVSIVKPGVLNNIVIEKKGDTFNINKLNSFASYFFWLKSFKQRGMPLLSKLIRELTLQ